MVADENKSALDILLADHTGPIAMTLWGDAISRFQEAQAKHQRDLSQNSKSQRSLILIESFRISTLSKNDYHGEVLTSMASLHSIEAVGDQSGTSFTCITEASSPYMLSTSFVIPLPPVCIHNFMSLQTKMAPPFKVTLYGVVQDVKGGRVYTKMK